MEFRDYSYLGNLPDEVKCMINPKILQDIEDLKYYIALDDNRNCIEEVIVFGKCLTDTFTENDKVLVSVKSSLESPTDDFGSVVVGAAIEWGLDYNKFDVIWPRVRSIDNIKETEKWIRLI